MSFARWWVLGRKNYDAPLITLVKLSGVLQASSGRGPAQGRRLLNLERIQKWIDRAFWTSIRPAACCIIINSPGGSPAQAELIHRQITQKSAETGIPVFTFAEDVAASGGYWLLCAGQEAYACETSILGSIGVISATFGGVEALRKLGLERRVFTAGESKVSMDPFLPVDPEQSVRLKQVMGDLHATFKAIVTTSRGDRLKTDHPELFSGRVWTGKQAVDVGLIDGVGSHGDVMREKYGDKVRFLLCSEPPQPSIRDYLGLGSSAGAASPIMDMLRARGGEGEDAAYAAQRNMVEAVADELEERTLWAKYKMG